MTPVTARVLLTDRPTAAAAVVAVGLLGLVGWSAAAGPPAAAGGGPAGFTHMHCPACGDERPYIASQAGTPCRNCVHKAALVPTVGTKRENEGGGGGDGGRWGRYVSLGLFAGLVLEGFAFACVLRLRALRRAAEAGVNRALTCRCGFCGQKIRFAASKAGTGALCPKCKTAFVLTPQPGSDAVAG